MALGHDYHIQRRHSCRPAKAGKRRLQSSCNENCSSGSPLSAGRMCVFAICLAAMVTHTPMASAKSLNRNHLRHSVLSNLRGGDIGGGGDQQINDEDLDEYIDFLLAYADDKATEADNPLFKDNQDVAPLLDSIEESTTVEEEEIQQEEEEEEESILADGLEPMVEDVNDDTQIDAMVETLIASVDDAELEAEVPVEDDVTIPTDETVVEAETVETTIEIAVTAEASTPEIQEEEEPAVESSSSETFYLGSSAVDNMPPPVIEEEPPKDTDIVTEATEDSEPRVGIFVSLMQKMGLKKSQEIAVEESTSPVQEEAATVEEAIVEVSEETSAPIDEEVDVDVAVEEAADPINEATTVVEETVGVDSSDLVEEPVITIGEVEETETTSVEEEAPKAKFDFMAPVTATMATLGSAKAATVSVLGKTGSATMTALGNTKTATMTALDNTKTATMTALDNTSKTVISSAKSYYEGAIGFSKGVWSRRPFQSQPEPPPERDYSKIYHKYFAADQEEPEEVIPRKSSRLGSVFLKPWGTVTKYLEPRQLLTGAEESYSIGIQGFVDKDASEDSMVETEQLDEAVEIVEEITESAEIEVEVVDEADDEVVTESFEVEVVDEADDEVVTESFEVEVDVADDVEDITEDAEVIDENIEVEGNEEERLEDPENMDIIEEGIIEIDVEAVGEDTQVIDESVDDEITEDAEVFAESAEAEVDVEEITEVTEIVSEIASVEVEGDEVEEVAEVIAETTEQEFEGEDILEHAEDITEVGSEDAEVEQIPEDKEVEEVADDIEDVEIEEVADEIEQPLEDIDVEIAIEDENKIVEDIDVEVASEEIAEETIAFTEEVDYNQLEIDEEAAIDADIEEVPEGVQIEIEVSPVDAEMEAVVEAVQDAGIVTESLEVENEKEETPEDLSVTQGIEVVADSIDVLSDAEDPTIEAHESIDSTEENTSPRRPFLSRLWGTTKVPAPNVADTVELDGETEDVITEETLDETPEEIDETVDEEEATTEEVPAKRNVFARLWGVPKERTEEVNDSEPIEDIEVDDVDVSVSIVEEDSLDAIEISESSSVEDMEDDMDVIELEESEERNVFQLHIPERREATEESSMPEIKSIVVDDDISESEEESEEVSSLQLHQEGSIIHSEEEDIVTIDDSVTAEAEMEAEYLSESEEEEVTLEGEFENVEDAESEESEDFVEELDEEEFVEDVSVAEDIDEALSEEIEEVEEEEESEKLIEEEAEEEVHGEILEEEILLEVVEMDESEEEELVYVADMDEDDSLVYEPYSLEVEIQNANFLTRFLVNKGLEQVVMVAIVVAQWIRLYILAPFLESIEWIKEGKAQDLIETVIKTRGGALSLSESEDADEEEEMEVEEEVSAEEESTDIFAESAPAKDKEEENTEEAEPAEGTAPAQDAPPAATRVPPNFLFRRLLDYGYIGHVLIMEIILGLEWMKVYIPQIQAAIDFVMHDVLKHKKRSGGRQEPDNLMNSGFVNIGEGNRVGRKSKKMRKKEDQKALEQLQEIGDVNQAKYSFVSQSFMERHGIGPFNVAVTEVELGFEPSKKRSSETLDEEEEDADSDSSWIMDALGVEKDQDDDVDSSKLPFDTSVGVSMGSGGPSVSVGFEFNVGGKSKKSKPSSLRNVLESSSATSKPKKRKPKVVSDSESGLMGRLRAQGANSLVGRSILGAYPGDLPPPDEAADSRGVIDMAERYGYGDWSDEDDDDDVFGFGDDEEMFQPRKKSPKRSKTKKRSSSSRNKQHVEIGVGLDLGSSSQDPLPVSSISTRKRKKKQNSASSLSVSSSLSESSDSRRRRKTRSSQLPSLAMEKIGKPSPSSRQSSTITSSSSAPKPSADATVKDLLSAAKKPKTKSLSPAMSLLDKAKQTGDASSKKDD